MSLTLEQPHIGTSNRKVRNSVRFGPPDVFLLFVFESVMSPSWGRNSENGPRAVITLSAKRLMSPALDRPGDGQVDSLGYDRF